VSVAREITQHLLGFCERLFGVHNPIDVAQWLQISRERGLIGEWHQMPTRANVRHCARTVKGAWRVRWPTLWRLLFRARKSASGFSMGL
jgi:hypothetical protein